MIVLQQSKSRPYRGCSASSPRAGTARTAPVWILRAAGHQHRPSVAAIRLDLGDMPWAGVPCWSGGPARWAQETVPLGLRAALHHPRPAGDARQPNQSENTHTRR